MPAGRSVSMTARRRRGPRAWRGSRATRWGFASAQTYAGISRSPASRCSARRRGPRAACWRPIPGVPRASLLRIRASPRRWPRMKRIVAAVARRRGAQSARRSRSSCLRLRRSRPWSWSCCRCWPTASPRSCRPRPSGASAPPRPGISPRRWRAARGLPRPATAPPAAPRSVRCSSVWWRRRATCRIRRCCMSSTATGRTPMRCRGAGSCCSPA